MSSRNLPHHLYVHVDSAFFRGGQQRFEPAVWFAIRSAPDEAWGCHVMLECGAVYRSLPPHALAFSTTPQLDWTLKQAQVWDCYGTEFDVIRYEYLAGLAARVNAAQGAGFPVRPDRQIDQLPEGVHGEQTVHDGHIGFIDLAGFKQRAQSPLHVRATGHQHQTAGGHVQPVYHQGIGVQRLHPCAQAVLLIGATARHGQEAGRFVQNQQAVVGKDDVHTAGRRGRFQGLPR